MLQHAVAAVLSAVALAPFSYYTGIAAKQIKLPQIIGYLISGIICGPYFLNILNTVVLQDLNIIEGACLGVIGLAAGAELYWADIQKSRRQVILITLGIAVFTWLYSFMAFLWMSTLRPLVPNMSYPQLLAVASLGSTLMIARSPAAAIAVLKELDSKGPFSSLVMAVVVVKDVLVITLFALNMDIIQGVVLPATKAASTPPWLQMLAPLLTLALSCVIGVAGALLLMVLMRQGAPGAGGGVSITTYRARMGTVFIMATLVFSMAHLAEADGLLACVAMGLVAANQRHERGEHEREQLHNAVNSVMTLTNVAFFGLAGASLKLDAVLGSLSIASIIFVVRMVAIFCGSWFGCYFGATSNEVRRLFWMTQVTQAGVAMGLARLVGARFPDWGPHFQTLMVSIIIINLFSGPPLFRSSLIIAGEAKTGAARALAKQESRESDVEAAPRDS